MKLLEVYIEHATHDLNRPFSYVYFGNKKVQKGFRVLVPFGGQKQIIGFVSAVLETNKTVEFSVNEKKIRLEFTKYEFKTVLFAENDLQELSEAII